MSYWYFLGFSADRAEENHPREGEGADSRTKGCPKRGQWIRAS